MNCSEFIDSIVDCIARSYVNALSNHRANQFNYLIYFELAKFLQTLGLQKLQLIGVTPNTLDSKVLEVPLECGEDFQFELAIRLSGTGTNNP